VRVLLVEDSERLQRSLSTALRRDGYAVDVTGSGTEARWLVRASRYDVVVLDIMLPGVDGLTVLDEMRGGGDETHVLLLTAKDTVEDRVRGLRTGADDYLTKPFAVDELLARVEALARRAYGRKNPLLRVGELHIDTRARTVSYRSLAIGLTPREYALLEYLARRQGEVVTRTEIENSLYDHNAELMSNVVDSAVCGLRRKIETAGAGALIRTRRGMGYVLQPATAGDASA
jgi:DNA-binding response OmpR family regulator